MTEPSFRCQFHLRYGQFTLNLDLTLPCGGIIGLFGHSGSGKTTLLRCIAGLEKAEPGFLQFAGEIWQNQSVFLPTHKRPIGYVFQEASLFPHLTVKGNLQFAQKRASASPIIKFQEAIDILNIGHLLNQHPRQLSGGERQRAAIARALLINPKLLLMDEPLASLDTSRKQEILPYLERLHRELTIPIIYVSHAIEEITRLSDYLVVMENGGVLANGPLTDTLARMDPPLNFGEDAGVVLHGEISERDSRWHLMKVTFDGGHVWLRDTQLPIGEPVRLRILAKDVSLALEKHDSSIVNLLPGSIDEIVEESKDGSALVRITVGGVFLIARVTQRSIFHLKLQPGSKVWVQIKSVALIQ